MSCNNSLDLDVVEHHFGTNFIEHTAFCRNLALDIDADPFTINKHKNSSTVKQLCQVYHQTSLEKTRWSESLSYGDAGVYLSLPGPSLAGTAIEIIGDDNQQSIFFNYIKKARCTSFAAITEPDHGSDLANIETTITRVDKNFYSITGKKCFITHGYDGEVGIVLARTGTGTFEIIGVLITKDELANGENNGTIKKELLPVIGLKGTCLSKIEFSNFLVPSQNLLGQHLRLMQRGMLAIIKTFNLMRPCVAGFVLGQTQGIVDYLSHNVLSKNTNLLRRITEINSEIALTRNSLYQAAQKVDKDPLETSFVSLIKAQITNLSERVCALLFDELEPENFFEHPMLLKWSRDCYGFEYMEGTTIMQKRNVYQKHLRQTLKNKKDNKILN